MLSHVPVVSSHLDKDETDPSIPHAGRLYNHRAGGRSSAGTSRRSLPEDAVIASYPPARPASARDLAEMIVSIIEGAFIFARSYQDRTFVARQSKQFRQYLELLFGEPRPAVGTRRAQATR
jgi:hypothetical protein